MSVVLDGQQPAAFRAVRRRASPQDALAALSVAPPGPRFYLERPASAEARVGVGAAAHVSASGPDRFREAGRRAEHLLARVELLGDEGPARAGPQVLGGFAFADASAGARDDGPWQGFGPASLVLPELLLVREGDAAWWIAVAPARADRDAQIARLDERIEAWRRAAARAVPPEPPPPSGAVEHRVSPDEAAVDFVARVERALRDVSRGELEKVVPARSVVVRRDGGWDPLALLAGLRADLPGCAAFLVTRGEGAFFGASPERLLRRRGRRVETTAVAGTAPRGRSPEGDRALARALLESKKEQGEHAIVRRFLCERLGRHATRVTAPEAPALLRLEGIQHLSTPVAAVLDRPVGALDLAGDLHPTPATAGAPGAAARAWLARHERLDRGWYAGPVGWCDAHGDGDLWVALRSGVVRGDVLRLFAGAGIVDGSDPRGELAETRLKLDTLLRRALEL